MPDDIERLLAALRGQTPATGPADDARPAPVDDAEPAPADPTPAPQAVGTPVSEPEPEATAVDDAQQPEAPPLVLAVTLAGTTGLHDEDVLEAARGLLQDGYGGQVQLSDVIYGVDEIACTATISDPQGQAGPAGTVAVTGTVTGDGWQAQLTAHVAGEPPQSLAQTMAAATEALAYLDEEGVGPDGDGLQFTVRYRRDGGAALSPEQVEEMVAVTTADFARVGFPALRVAAVYDGEQATSVLYTAEADNPAASLRLLNSVVAYQGTRQFGFGTVHATAAAG